MGIQFLALMGLTFCILHLLAKPGKRSMQLSDGIRERALTQNRKRDEKALADLLERTKTAPVYGPTDEVTQQKVRASIALVNRPIELTDEEQEEIRKSTRRDTDEFLARKAEEFKKAA